MRHEATPLKGDAQNSMSAISRTAWLHVAVACVTGFLEGYDLCVIG